MQDNKNGSPLQDNFLLYEGLTELDILDTKDVQKLQDKFCEVADVFAYCADAQGRALTQASGNPEELAILRKSVEQERIEALSGRVAGSSLEDQAVEDTAYDNLKIAAVSVKLNDKTVAVWFIYAVLYEASVGLKPGIARITGVSTMTNEKRLYASLDLLRETCIKLLRDKYRIAGVEAESMRTKFSEQEMGAALKRSAAFTEIVQLLDSDEPVETVLGKMLGLAGGYLNISSAQVFRLGSKADERPELLAEWVNRGIVSVFQENRRLDGVPAIFKDKAMVVSGGSCLMPAEAEFIEKMHVRAAITMPIIINDRIGMYASFCECKSSRGWELDEIKFVSDTVKVLQSVLTRRIQKNSLAGSYRALESILDNVGASIYVKDNENGRLLFANATLRRSFKEELKDGTLDLLFTGAVPEGETAGNYEMHSPKHSRWYDLYYTTIGWMDGSPVSLYAAYDITDKKVYQKKIEQQAYTDFLTGLYNRMCCERDLGWYIEESKRTGMMGALLYLDLDDFKHINDGLGHQYGDVLLKAISHSLKRIEGIDNSCYRMGGDEFVIIIPPVHFAKFNKIVSEIKEIFEKPWFLKDADYYCTMSMGIVNFPDEGDNVQDLIKKADIAMYEAKKTGKNRTAQYSDSYGSSSSKRLDMEKNMRDATVDGYKEFEVYYQPIIDTRRDGSPCTGAEALIRWNSSELGFISPAEFIPLAEYLGLINPIGNYVLRQACIACKRWNDSGRKEYKVNVNLSVVQLLQPDIVEVVRQTIEETGITPQNLTLEVTESLAINDMERMKEILGRIKELGVRIALDDFGTGYSSLNHIREIPFDVIKVDQSFVKDLAKDSYSQSFIKMVSELADAIDVNVCVEGIETKEQYEVLEGMKVSLVQGYYFDKPMPRKQFEDKYIYPAKVKKTVQRRKKNESIN